ncbi:tautomerase family protein [Aminobacter sp. AP02]|uniref:tautomerase family protein n=1 Tax=Aminobacter sp. AP02 TaxID=2135737 RepID=UPI000D6C70DE|nr:tautomerase family protein [Aminobacter sp. AP02]PWK75558.1 4-oxalocrotonate tautomerase [Aminobacter sp. AP02]
MPILSVKIAAQRSDTLTGDVAAMLAEHTSNILGKKPEVTAIAITYVDPRDWIVAGRTLQQHGKSSFALEIKVTDETNTKDEKKRYIQAVFDGFANILGAIHEESYIHVHDVKAAAYGYGGKTQEFRYHHS